MKNQAPLADAALQAVMGALEQITEMTVVWPRGLMHPGGPHWRPSCMIIPISVGADECALLRGLVTAFRPKDCFIIGNAFGLSSAYIARVMEDHGGESVVTLDNGCQGDGAVCARIADQLKDKLGLRILTCKRGTSPQDIARAVAVPKHDMIFIDGLHQHPQVTHDFVGCLPYAHERTIWVWHDFWLPGIPECVDYARSLGIRCLWVPTSCEMVVGTRDPEHYATLQKLFPNGREDRRAYPAWVRHLKNTQFMLSYARDEARRFAARVKRKLPESGRDAAE
jgi:predicted O-methyltransferase YrrM